MKKSAFAFKLVPMAYYLQFEVGNSDDEITKNLLKIGKEFVVCLVVARTA